MVKHIVWPLVFYMCATGNMKVVSAGLTAVDEGEVVAVAFGGHLGGRDEAEGRAVDAVSQSSGRTRAVVEHVAEMGVADGAAHFDAPHPVGIVGALRQHVGRYGAAERGPATPGVELVRRYEQRLPGSEVDIYAGPEFPVIFVNVGPLGSAELRDGILLGRQPTPQFLVRRLAVSSGSLTGMFQRRVFGLRGHLHQGRIDMAVSPRILHEILLMIILSRIEILQRLDLHRYRAVIPRSLPVDGLVDDRPVGAIAIVYPRPILRADVVALTVQSSRIDRLEIQIDKEWQ